MNWPDDADGDVLRSLEEDGFDFNKEYLVDFDVDFNKWPPSKNEEQEIKKLYPNCRFYDPLEEDIEDGNTIGYVNIQIESKITYEFVIKTQEEITKTMKPFGGWCEAWGVMGE